MASSSSDHRTRAPEPVLWTIRDAATATGIKRSTLYEQLNSRRLPGLVKLGTRSMVHRAVLLEHLDRIARGEVEA